MKWLSLVMNEINTTFGAVGIIGDHAANLAVTEFDNGTEHAPIVHLPGVCCQTLKITEHFFNSMRNLVSKKLALTLNLSTNGPSELLVAFLR